METLIVCLIIAALLPYLAKVPVAISMNKLGGYDNSQPRAQQARLTDFGARALAAHQNAFESFLIFAPAVVLAIALGKTGPTMEYLALGHVASRIAYNALYLIDRSTERSIVWFIGITCTFMIYFNLL
jgi:uncharacterized MAPEG superfamily protein